MPDDVPPPSLAPVTLPPVDASGVLPRRPTARRHVDGLTRQHELGRGGMGAVWAARDPVLHREVAVKEILGGSRSRWAQRFATEARVTAQLDHPHIVPVYDADLDPEQGLAYSMKRIEGETLGARMEASAAARAGRGPVPDALAFDTLLDLFAKVCDAVAYAHSRGVVHRDLKPDNIMVGAHGTLYVMDWGLAGIEGGGGLEGMPEHQVTLPGYALGTAAWMAPEQATGQPMGPACDQYALGLILHQMITGRPPRPAGGDLQESLQRAATGFTLPLRALGRERLRRELRAIVARATAHAPSDRYPSVRALADDLRRFRADQPVRTAPDTLLQAAQRRLARHREAVVRLGLLLGLVGVVGGATVALVALGGAGWQASRAEAREAHRTQLVADIGSQAAAVDRVFREVQAQVEGMAAATGVLLQQGPVRDDVPVLAPSVFAGEGAPDDTAWSEAYARPISTHWADIVIAPGVDRAAAVAQARRLTPLRHTLREAHLSTRQRLQGLDPAAAEATWRHDLGPLRWAIVGTPEGLYLEMPGAAWDVAGFDPRQRPWYTQATSHVPAWGAPYPEASTGTLLVACSVQVPGADGHPLGVASLSVPLQWLTGQHLAPTHPAVQGVYLVDAEARVLVPTEGPSLHAPGLAEALGDRAGRLEAADGSLLLHYPLSNGWWFVARVDEGAG